MTISCAVSYRRSSAAGNQHHDDAAGGHAEYIAWFTYTTGSYGPWALSAVAGGIALDGAVIRRKHPSITLRDIDNFYTPIAREFPPDEQVNWTFYCHKRLLVNNCLVDRFSYFTIRMLIGFFFFPCISFSFILLIARTSPKRSYSRWPVC